MGQMMDRVSHQPPERGHEPIRGQYQGHVTSIDQSEASIHLREVSSLSQWSWRSHTLAAMQRRLSQRPVTVTQRELSMINNIAFISVKPCPQTLIVPEPHRPSPTILYSPQNKIQENSEKRDMEKSTKFTSSILIVALLSKCLQDQMKVSTVPQSIYL